MSPREIGREQARHVHMTTAPGQGVVILSPCPGGSAEDQKAWMDGLTSELGHLMSQKVENN